MIHNKGYATCLGVIGLLMLSNNFFSTNNLSSINDELIAYWGLFFLVLAIISLFLNGRYSLEIKLANYLGRFLGLTYLASGTALIIEGGRNNNSQLLCWGVLFLTVGSTPFYESILNGWQNLKNKIKNKQLN